MPRKKEDFSNNIAKVVNDFSLDEIMEDGFGRYSKEIIQERALPDVRDGLNLIKKVLRLLVILWVTFIHMVIHQYMMR